MLRKCWLLARWTIAAAAFGSELDGIFTINMRTENATAGFCQSKRCFSLTSILSCLGEAKRNKRGKPGSGEASSHVLLHKRVEKTSLFSLPKNLKELKQTSLNTGTHAKINTSTKQKNLLFPGSRAERQHPSSHLHSFTSPLSNVFNGLFNLMQMGLKLQRIQQTFPSVDLFFF